MQFEVTDMAGNTRISSVKVDIMPPELTITQGESIITSGTQFFYNLEGIVPDILHPSSDGLH